MMIFRTLILEIKVIKIKLPNKRKKSILTRKVNRKISIPEVKMNKMFKINKIRNYSISKAQLLLTNMFIESISKTTK